jgi:tetratricopeptide (TPR) repeat protein
MSTKQNCDLIRRALDLHKTGQTRQAIDELQEHLEERPHAAKLWELLGVLSFAIDDTELARAAIEQASIMIPLSARGQLVLAKCYDALGYREAAGAIYRHVATLDSLDDELMEPLAAGLGRYGEYQHALAICRTAAKRMPDNPEPLKGIVHYMRRLRMPVERILPTLFRAHHLAPEDKDCRISLAWLLHETGQSNDGAALLEAVDTDDFSCIRCLTLMQHIFEAAGHSDRATDCRNRLKVLAGEWPGA